MRVAFLGSQEIGARCLEVVLDAGHEVVGVGAFEAGGHERWADDVERVVQQRGLPRIRGRRFRTTSAVQELRTLAPDILFAIGWRWILPPEVLAIPSKGCLGIHGSLLPRLRGFAPVNWALIRDELRTGPTLFYFDEGMDTGDVVGQIAFEITDEDDAGTVRRRIVEAARELLVRHLSGLADGTAPRIPQPAEGATYGEQRRPEDGAIDWTLEPRAVFNWVRALARPYPGAFTELDGRRVTIWKVRVSDAAGAGPGVLSPGARLLVGARRGAVEILDAAYEGDDAVGALERVARELRARGRFAAQWRG